MKENNNASTVGVGFLGMLFLLFLGLKLAGKIEWSWFWVFSPIWGPIALVIAVVGIAALVLAISNALKKKADKNE